MTEKGEVLEYKKLSLYISVIKGNKVVDKISLSNIEVNGVFSDYYKNGNETDHDSYNLLMKYDRKTKKTEKLTQISKDMDIADVVYMNDNNLYAITFLNNYKLINYDIKERHSNTIFETGGRQAINNCQIYVEN